MHGEVPLDGGALPNKALDAETASLRKVYRSGEDRHAVTGSYKRQKSRVGTALEDHIRVNMGQLTRSIEQVARPESVVQKKQRNIFELANLNGARQTFSCLSPDGEQL